ncbi:alpha/beta fold hydrolase [Cryobacterium sp. BB736]|uniref:alpha/beta fold hydrolase n=1 Tax=Cryobacterium sp. BB736 TaxID=2746963 RepID=UPI00187399F6|nr:alpha/beta fold hydrolase [Cryobacterium sp. BB736]
MDAASSRLVIAPDAQGRPRTWHLLDNGARLAELGVTATGTILCVHGNPTWSYLWRGLVSAATDAAGLGDPAWRVIAVDQLDMGFSERTGETRGLPGRVSDLSSLTDALELNGPVFTLGHDWGGPISLGWAIDHPQLLAGVMLLNTAVHHPGGPIPVPLRLALSAPVLGPATVSTPAFLESTLALAHPPLTADLKRGYRAPYRTAGRRGGIGAFVADIPIGADHPSRAELDRIADGVRNLRRPALLLWGPLDPIFSDNYLDDLIERMPQADVHRFEGAGHLVAEDADYASAVLAWLDEQQAVGQLDPPFQPATAVAAGSDRPLWHHLEALRDSSGTALVELAPPRGRTPRVVSWRLLSRRVRQIAAGLTRCGVKSGDRVSLLIPPGADLTAVLYACLRIGAVVVVADAGLGLGGLTRAVRGARPDHIVGAAPGLTAARALGWPGQRIATARLAPGAKRALGVSHLLADVARLGFDEELPPPPSAADTAAVLFTSGSTGPAKGVVYTHAQLAALCKALADQYGVGTGTGLVAGFAPFALLGPALGARSVTPDMNVTSPKTLTASAVAAAVAAANVDTDSTVVFLSPAALSNVVATADALTAADHSALGRVELFLSAGAPVSESLLTAASALMPAASAHTPYGMTEGLLLTDVSLQGIWASAAVAADGPGGVCVGFPTATTQVQISPLDENGNAVGAPMDAPNVTGEIVVSAAHLKDRYDRLWLTNEAATRGTGAGRWHRTGDVGHLDEQGRLWVEGRLPHVITTAAGVLTPVGPEQAIESVPAIARAAVVGVGPAGTQQVVAVVETIRPAPRVSLASTELAASVRASVSHPIAAVLVVPRLPTDIRHNSKINRTRLADWATRLLAGGRMVRP